jgi:hypothetical protein
MDGRYLVKGGVCVTPYALLSTQVQISILEIFIFNYFIKDIDENTSNQYQYQYSAKLPVIEELMIFNKDDLSSYMNAPSKSNLTLPSIISRQRTLSSFTSNVTTTPVDYDSNNKFTLPSRQTTFMKSISEIS